MERVELTLDEFAYLRANPPADGKLVAVKEVITEIGAELVEDVYVDGFGQVVAAHSPEKCEGRPCVIHNQSDHNMRGFPTFFRFDRYLMERHCPHGVGHPDPDDAAWQNEVMPERAASVHGCDGCCMTLEKREELGLVQDS